MIKKTLSGSWRLSIAGERGYINAVVPGTVYTDMIREGLLKEPYWRSNSDEFEKLMDKEYVYEREFEVTKSDMQYKNIQLCCEGLDTLCELSVTGRCVASTNNMHIEWVFNVGSFLHIGKNSISVTIKSPNKYISEKNSERKLLQTAFAMDGFPYIRKAHSMLGWDWGPKMPDGGIWKDIYLRFYNGSLIDSVYIRQTHKEDKVILDIIPEMSTDEKVKYTAVFDGKSYEFYGTLKITVEDARLWYPSGYGEAYLYDFFLRAEGDETYDEYKCRIGLRKCEVINEPDEYGECFYFKVNDIPVFIKGSNYIPEDSLLSGYSPERTRKLIEAVRDGNHNMIRVWGGGIYPHGYFYDICDELGILVWQDLMFACAQYPADEAFYKNIASEAEYNVKRLRNHACLAMWCGNNECEVSMGEWWGHDGRSNNRDRAEYLIQYEYVLADVLKKCDTERLYWPSSPSGGGGFVNAGSGDCGDIHFWTVWGHKAPMTEYTKYYCRFMSEFGFQAFPAIESVMEFTEEEDRNIFSRVMECHQKDKGGNGKIMHYLAEEFRYPRDFDSLLYISQLLQAESIRIAVEHLRRNRNGFRCMGALYWQLNDCWPTASWAGIDYYGRWKALHYRAKDFYSDIHMSALCNGSKAEIWVTSDRTAAESRNMYMKIRRSGGEVLEEESTDFEIHPLMSELVFSVEQPESIYDTYIEFGIDNQMSGVLLLCPNKYFEYKNPEISYSIKVQDGRSYISLRCKSFANFVELKADNNTVIFSDNYFAMSPGEEKIVTCEGAIDSLSVRSLYDTY